MRLCVVVLTFMTFGGPKPSLHLRRGAILLGPTTLRASLRVQTWLRSSWGEGRVVVGDLVVTVGVGGWRTIQRNVRGGGLRETVRAMADAQCTDPPVLHTNKGKCIHVFIRLRAHFICMKSHFNFVI